MLYRQVRGCALVHCCIVAKGSLHGSWKTPEDFLLWSERNRFQTKPLESYLHLGSFNLTCGDPALCIAWAGLKLTSLTSKPAEMTGMS